MASHAPILMADDEESDALLVKLALEESGLPNPLTVVKDGREAVRYLDGQPPYANRVEFPLPGLLLLDLKMPRMDGFDVLSWIKSQPKLQGVPVVVFTSSWQEYDRAKASQLGAREYVVKPSGFHELVQVLRDLSGRWLGVRVGPS